MAKVIQWKGFVDGAVGKICTHQSDKYTYKTPTGKYATGLRCNERNYSTNPVTANETKNKNIFKAAAAAAKAALASPATLATLQNAFNAQKADGYKTLRGYVFAQKYAEEKAKA